LPNGRPASTTGTPEAVQVQRPLAVHADKNGAVHMAAAQITGCDLVIARRVHHERVRHEQDELNSAC
jgi:hypothetical protein